MFSMRLGSAGARRSRINARDAVETVRKSRRNSVLPRCNVRWRTRSGVPHTDTPHQFGNEVVRRFGWYGVRQFAVLHTKPRTANHRTTPRQKRIRAPNCACQRERKSSRLNVPWKVGELIVERLNVSLPVGALMPL